MKLYWISEEGCVKCVADGDVIFKIADLCISMMQNHMTQYHVKSNDVKNGKTCNGIKKHSHMQ